MTDRTTAERALVEACLDHVRMLPFVRRVAIEALPTASRDAGCDATMVIETPTGRVLLPCEVKHSNLGHESARFLVHRSREHKGMVLLAPLVGRELGDFLERADQNFVDGVGNCYLRIGQRYLARIQGRTTPGRRASDRGMRAAAYRVLFALLVKPELIGAPVRAIAAQVNVSPQTASNLLRVLADRGLAVAVQRRRQWTPGRRKDAIDTWLAGFRSVLAPALLVGRFRAKETDPREFERRIEPVLDGLGEWRYGGGAAAMRLAHHYRGDTTVLYLRDAPLDFPARLRLARDAAGPIVIARAPGAVAFESPEPRSVHPLLAYADLLAEGHERASEAAGMLYERFLARQEKNA